MTSLNPVGQPSRWARSGGEDEPCEATRDIWVSGPFMSRCRKLINVSTADRVCFVDDISTVKKKKKKSQKYIIWHTFFQNVTYSSQLASARTLTLTYKHRHFTKPALGENQEVEGGGGMSEEDKTVHKSFEIRILDFFGQHLIFWGLFWPVGRCRFLTILQERKSSIS